MDDGHIDAFSNSRTKERGKRRRGLIVKQSISLELQTQGEEEKELEISSVIKIVFDLLH